MMRRRRRTVILAVLLLSVSLLVVRIFQDSPDEKADAAPTWATSSEAPASPSDDPLSTGTPSPTPPVIEEGKGTFDYAAVPEDASIAGDDGEIMTYRVAVEEGIAELPAEFAEFVDRVFQDERGWTADGDWRFEHVSDDRPSFTIYLVSPTTRAKLCGTSDTYTSCRQGDAVVINLARWLNATKHWDAPVEDYRAYVVNHEVGHRLGEGHVVCPKAGEPSPVMAQQTLGLHGCEPNAWPYVDGEYLTGPAGEYE